MPTEFERVVKLGKFILTIPRFMIIWHYASPLGSITAFSS